MTARLPNPLIVAIAALLLAVAAAAGSFWLKADIVVANVLKSRREHLAVAAAKVAEVRAQGWDFWTIEVSNLETELRDEKLSVLKKEDQLAQQQARIAAERQELERVRSEILAMRQEIDDRVIAIRADENHNLRSLAQTYSTLTESSATATVAIMREMDDNTVVKILSLMKSDVVGAIFEEMSKTPGPDGTLSKRAALLSERLRLMKTAQVPAPTS
jgi:flagellar motility protein MotE (MotC chaperone)